VHHGSSPASSVAGQHGHRQTAKYPSGPMLRVHLAGFLAAIKANPQRYWPLP
jgi:hypothetical protein